MQVIGGTDSCDVVNTLSKEGPDLCSATKSSPFLLVQPCSGGKPSRIVKNQNLKPLS